METKSEDTHTHTHISSIQQFVVRQPLNFSSGRDSCLELLEVLKPKPGGTDILGDIGSDALLSLENWTAQRFTAAEELPVHTSPRIG